MDIGDTQDDLPPARFRSVPPPTWMLVTWACLMAFLFGACVWMISTAWLYGLTP